MKRLQDAIKNGISVEERKCPFEGCDYTFTVRKDDEVPWIC
jgi:hypothetical protein